MLQNVTQNLVKRDLTSRAIITARVLAMMHNGKSKDSNLTTQGNDIVHLNCSTYGLTCSRVHCDLSLLKTQRDVGKLVMRLILNATKLKGIEI